MSIHPTFEDYQQSLRGTAANRLQGGKSPKKLSLPLQPLVSIITVVRNNKKALEATLKSVIDQNYQNIEYIIIDGASTDGTVELLIQYEDQVTCWISEPDDGIADAWNKGLAICTGDIIGFLNADDFLSKNSVHEAVQLLSSDRPSLTYSNVVLIDTSGNHQKIIYGNFRPLLLFRGLGFLHPGSFATRSCYEKIGLFSTDYRMAMDCDWLLRCYLNDVLFIKSNSYCYMRNDGISNRAWKQAWEEYLVSLQQNGFPRSLNIISRGYLLLVSISRYFVGIFHG